MARILVREKCFVGYSKLFRRGYEIFAHCGVNVEQEK